MATVQRCVASRGPEGLHLSMAVDTALDTAAGVAATDVVLGLSMTPTSVGLVMLEGSDADGVTMDRDAFQVRSRGRAGAVQTCERAAAAVMRSEAIAATHGHRLHSIGVTWSDDAYAEATLLLKSLSESGFHNVVPVRFPEATEALARGVADSAGYQTTAVCVIEPETPETAVTLIVHADPHNHEDVIQTARNHVVETEEDLLRWLSAVFTRADWQPEALVMVGSGGDLNTLLPTLEDVLDVPVFTPAEAELALARGAAMASAHSIGSGVDADFDLGYGYYDDGPDDPIGMHDPDVGTHRKAQPVQSARTAPVGPLAMLVGGVLAFVVSSSVAIGLHLVPTSHSTPSGSDHQSERTSAETPTAVQPARPALPPPSPPQPIVEPDLPSEPAQLPPTPSEGTVEEEQPVPDSAPAADTPAQEEPAVPVEAAPGTPQAPGEYVPPPPTGNVISDPGAKPPLLTRILGHMPGHNNDAVPQQPQVQAPMQQPPEQPAAPVPELAQPPAPAPPPVP